MGRLFKRWNASIIETHMVSKVFEFKFDRSLYGWMNENKIIASFVELCDNPEGLCDGRLPSDSALGRFSPKFYKSCDLAQSMILRTIFRHLNWLEDIWWPKIVILFLELAPSIVGRPTPAPVPPILLVILRLLIESLFGARSSEARVIWTGGYRVPCGCVGLVQAPGG